MSAKHGPPKRSDESYATPPFCCESLLSELSLPGGRWLEPCAGDGAIIRAVSALRGDVSWAACEVREACREPLRAISSVEQVVLGDFFAPESQQALMEQGKFDVIITNPPFSLAGDFINACLPLATVTIMLLRLNYLEGAERAPFWRCHAPDCFVLPNRPSFTGHGTDATAYCWMVFYGNAERTHGHLRVLPVVPAEQRKSR